MSEYDFDEASFHKALFSGAYRPIPETPPEAAIPTQRTSFLDAVKSGALNQEADVVAAGITGRDSAARKKYLELSKQAGEAYTGPEWEDVKADPFSMKPLNYVKGKVGQQVAPMTTYLGVGALGGMGGAALAPTPATAPFGAAIGSTAAISPLFYGSNIGRQTQEQEAAIARGEVPKEYEHLNAAMAAPAQAALERFALGKVFKGTRLGTALGQEGEKLTEAQLRSVAGEGALKTMGKAAGRGMVAEVPVEVGQQALERGQAGLDLTSPAAMKEYEQTVADTIASIGPISGVHGLARRSGARSDLRDLTKPAENEAAAPQGMIGDMFGGEASAPNNDLTPTGLPANPTYSKAREKLFTAAGQHIDVATMSSFDSATAQSNYAYLRSIGMPRAEAIKQSLTNEELAAQGQGMLFHSTGKKMFDYAAPTVPRQAIEGMLAADKAAEWDAARNSLYEAQGKQNFADTFEARQSAAQHNENVQAEDAQAYADATYEAPPKRTRSYTQSETLAIHEIDNIASKLRALGIDVPAHTEPKSLEAMTPVYKRRAKSAGITLTPAELKKGHLQNLRDSSAELQRLYAEARAPADVIAQKREAAAAKRVREAEVLRKSQTRGQRPVIGQARLFDNRYDISAKHQPGEWVKNAETGRLEPVTPVTAEPETAMTDNVGEKGANRKLLKSNNVPNVPRAALTKEKQNAVQIEEPSKGVQRRKRPEVELQEVGKGNAQPQEAAAKSEAKKEVKGPKLKAKIAVAKEKKAATKEKISAKETTKTKPPKAKEVPLAGKPRKTVAQGGEGVGQGGLGLHPDTPDWYDMPSENAFAGGMSQGQIHDEWIANHKIPVNEDGTVDFYHASPSKLDVIRANSYLETDPQKAKFFAARDRGLNPDDMVLHKIRLPKYDFEAGVFPTLRKDYKITDGQGVKTTKEKSSAKETTKTKPTKAQQQKETPAADLAANVKAAEAEADKEIARKKQATSPTKTIQALAKEHSDLHDALGKAEEEEDFGAQLEIVDKLKKFASDNKADMKAIEAARARFEDVQETAEEHIPKADAYGNEVDEKTDWDNKHSESAKPDNPVAAKKLAKILKGVFRGAALFDKIVRIYATQEEAAVDGNLSGAKGRVLGFKTPDGKVGLIAENIEDGKELGVFLHEVGVHLGMEKLVGKANMRWLDSRILEWSALNDGSKESEAAKAAVARSEESTTDDNAEGRIAYMVEELVNRGVKPTALGATPAHIWFRRLWAATKASLRKLGFRRADFSGQNLVDIAYGAAHIELEGAWHGTAAKFRKFHHAYMGSGEGAQAYGWGTYLAQREGIGRDYMNQDVRRKGVKDFSLDTLREVKAVRSQMERILDKYDIDWSNTGYPSTVYSPEMDRLSNSDFLEYEALEAQAAKILEEGTIPVREGSLMRVASNVRDDEFLDWYKPLSEQSEKVKAALDSIDWDIRETAHDTFGDPDPSGRELYSTIASIEDSKEAASKYLDSIGIKGIKFLDQPSRQTVVGEWVITETNTETGRKELFTYITKAKADAAYENMTSEVDALHSYSKPEQSTLEKQTSNLVIFNDKNIVRAVTYPGGNKDAPKFSEATVSVGAKQIAEKYFGPAGERIVTDTSHELSKMVGHLEFLHNIIDRVKSDLPSAKTWHTELMKMAATKERWSKKAETIATLASKLGEDSYVKTNDFISKSTFEQKWGYQPEWLKNRRDSEGALIEDRLVVIDPGMRKAWDSLNQKERAVVAAVFEHGEEIAEAKFALFKKLGISGLFSKMGKLDGPYAPLNRKGNYVAVLKSQALLDAEAVAAKEGATAKDVAKVEELKADEANFILSYFGTMGQAAQFAKEEGKKYAFNDAFAKTVQTDNKYSMGYKTLSRVMESLKADKGIPAGAKAAMEDTLKAMYMSSVDQHNARASSVRRKGRAGFDKNMVSSFLSDARAQAAFIANLEHGPEVNKAFFDMKEQVKDEKTGKRLNQDDFNLISAHYAKNMEYKDTFLSRLDDQVVGITSAWQLATSIGYHLNNLSQVLMVTVPKLAADYSYRAALKHTWDGYNTVKSLWKDGRLDISSLEKSKPALYKMLKVIEERNLLDVGMEENLSHFERTQSGYAAVDKTTAAASNAIHKLRQVSRTVEMVNRIASAVAAYNIAVENKKSSEVATEYALDVVANTQGDFTRSDAPLILKNLPKVVGQYRKFQILMMTFYASSYQKAFHGATPEEKRIGKRMLAFKLAHTAVASGLLGFPLMNLAALVFGMAGGDEPDDLETMSMEQATKLLGSKDLATLLLRGPLAFTGLDMTKLGDNNVFSLLPYSDIDFTSRAGVAKTLMGAAGPAAGQLGRFSDGVGLIGQGDTYKGIEKFMPKGVEQAMASFRMANDGYSMKNGDVIVKPEDLKAFSLTLNALGLTSTQIKEVQRSQNVQYQITQYYSSKTKEIEHAYKKAFDEKDTSKMAELRKDWMDMQKSKDAEREHFNFAPHALKKQPLSNLLRYPMLFKKAEREKQREQIPQ